MIGFIACCFSLWSFPKLSLFCSQGVRRVGGVGEGGCVLLADAGQVWVWLVEDMWGKVRFVWSPINSTA